jgi:hypothetical protein
MSIEAAACAAAARSLGYPTFAQLIIDRQLPPSAVADLFRHSVVKDGMTLAVILLAGATARHHADPQHWNGDTEKALAMQALGSGDGFDKACKRARLIVSSHWPQIASEA